MAASFKNKVALPTLERLHVQLPKNEPVDAHAIATEWTEVFAAKMMRNDADGVAELFLEDGLWRDMLAFTWEFRTFHGTAHIRTFLTDRLAETKVVAVRLASTDGERKPTLFDAVPGLVWVQAFLEIETAVGLCTGIVRVVPTSHQGGLKWKAHCFYSNLDELKGFPWRVGPQRFKEPVHGLWEEQRAKEANFEDADPTVLIVGGGHSGLDVAARLSKLGVTNLVVERNPRIGDNWRNRYKALCLHDPVWYDHMPWMKFPESWPVFSPAPKLADWLETYAHSMELNVWTSTAVTSLKRDDAKGDWVATVSKPGSATRTMRVKHVVLATGLGAGKLPQFPGEDEFQGKITHAFQHTSAADYAGKKAVVIGACTSAHDVAQDFYRHGVDVTMVQRSSTCVISVARALPLYLAGLYEEGGPSVEVADLVNASFPNHVTRLIHKGLTPTIKEVDRETLDGLERVGFKTNWGEDETGWFMMAWEKAGGYYLDVGASQLIIDGKIKLKSGSGLQKYVKDGVVLENGTHLPADVVVLATGLRDVRDPLSHLVGEELAGKVPPVWGLNAEGEMNSVWRECGLPNMYFIIGNLALCRFHSTHIALQIKAMEEGKFSSRYTK